MKKQSMYEIVTRFSEFSKVGGYMINIEKPISSIY